MNPIIYLLKCQTFTNADYRVIESQLNEKMELLKKLNINTIKELLYNKINKQCVNTIDMKDIQQLNEIDCMMYNKMYNSEFHLPDYLTLINNEKSKLAMSILNTDQRLIVYNILEKISCSFNRSGSLNKPITVLLDAPSGTGKSFLIDCMCLCMRHISTCVIARNKTLLSKICTLTDVDTDVLKVMTTCKFTMDYFRLTYDTAIKIFNDVYNNIESVKELVTNILCEYVNWDFNLLIIDEYSMESPLLLMMLILIAKKQRVNILIMGDIKQQNTLTPSRFHKDTNYNLLNILPNVYIYKLQEQMRIKDSELNQLIEGIKHFISDDCAGNVKNTFILKYYIYLQCRSKFLKCGNILTDVYLTDTHKNIKKRIEQIESYAKKHNISHVQEPFEVQYDDKRRLPLALPPNDKFVPHLLLVIGCKYLYNKNTLVTLTKINNQNVEVVTVNGTLIRVTKALWTKQNHECVDSNFKWLMRYVGTIGTLVQYPLRPAMFTYYFVQGLTFHEDSVCIDLDSELANSLYVGFSRVTNMNQITELQSVDFISMMYTQYKDDNYYYRVPKPNTSIIDHMQEYFKNKFYKFDDSKYNFKEVTLDTFEKCKSTLKYIKTLKVNNILNKNDTVVIPKVSIKQITELGKLLLSQYDDV